jgi:hypothetical protein
MHRRWLLLSTMLCAMLVGTAANAQTRRHRRNRHRGAAEAPAPRAPVAAATPTPAPSAPRPPQPEDPPLFYAPPGYVPANPYRAGGSEGRHFGVVAENDILATMRTAPVRGNLRNYGNTSVNIRVDFPGPIDGSYKPSEQRHEEHWRAEIAAFRLNQLLGLERVPPAVFRQVLEDDLPTGERYGVTFTDGVSRGAMIYWVPVLRPSGVGSPESMDFWSQRLTAGVVIADAERARAREVSDLIVFDFLIANWDRWNGLNTLEDGAGHLVFRDNNAGFQVPSNSSRYQRVLGWLHRSQRFSRSLIARARELDLDTLRDAMADDADGNGAVLLSDEQLRDVLRRRDVLVAYVDALVRRYGEDNVIAFP